LIFVAAVNGTKICEYDVILGLKLGSPRYDFADLVSTNMPHDLRRSLCPGDTGLLVEDVLLNYFDDQTGNGVSIKVLMVYGVGCVGVWMGGERCGVALWSGCEDRRPEAHRRFSQPTASAPVKLQASHYYSRGRACLDYPMAEQCHPHRGTPRISRIASSSLDKVLFSYGVVWFGVVAFLIIKFGRRAKQGIPRSKEQMPEKRLNSCDLKYVVVLGPELPLTSNRQDGDICGHPIFVDTVDMKPCMIAYMHREIFSAAVPL
jgi:hypothetical protein